MMGQIAFLRGCLSQCVQSVVLVYLIKLAHLLHTVFNSDREFLSTKYGVSCDLLSFCYF